MQRRRATTSVKVWQSCFAVNAARDPIKRPIVFGNKVFADWLRENQDLL
jgi:hypothetical protein